MKIKTTGYFEASHRLSFYEGKCNRIHGHNWKVDVEIDSDTYDHIVWDFSNLKECLKEYDHKLIVMDNKENRELLKNIPISWISYMLEEPTAENFANELAELIFNEIKPIPNYVKVKVWENHKSFAEARWEK